LAVARLPMVIAYRVAPMTAFIIRRLLTVHYACLINLLLDRLVVPEYLQEDCTSDQLLPAILTLFIDEAARQRQLTGCADALARLGMPGETPSRRAALEALAMIKETKI
jgi:lipid-A-disaccharide synthase